MLTNGFAFGMYMNDINNIFFELIRVAIGNAGCLSHTPTAAEWNVLYAMAKEQSLVGICFAGVQRQQSNRNALQRCSICNGWVWLLRCSRGMKWCRGGVGKFLTSCVRLD